MAGDLDDDVDELDDDDDVMALLPPANEAASSPLLQFELLESLRKLCDDVIMTAAAAGVGSSSRVSTTFGSHSLLPASL